LTSLSLPGTTVRRSGSAIITNGRSDASAIGQDGSRISAASKNQLEPSPHELPVKDTDRAIDVTSVKCKYTKIVSIIIISLLLKNINLQNNKHYNTIFECSSE